MAAVNQVASSRAGLFGNWVRLQWSRKERGQLASPAFEVGERLRSRVVLERVAQAGAPSAADGTRDQMRRQLDRRIAETQRRLLSPAFDPAERRNSLGELRLLELEREDLNDGRVPALPSNAVPFASLQAVQRTLGEHEAMVWFSMAQWTDLYGEFGGGSWAVTITRDTATIHRLSTGDDLDVQVAALIGLMRDRRTARDAWAPAARRLGDVLLGDALAQLPSTVTQLVMVTDGALHRMPFEVLAPGAGPMLGERFDISVTPSDAIGAPRDRPSARLVALVLAVPTSREARTADRPRRPARRGASARDRPHPASSAGPGARRPGVERFVSRRGSGRSASPTWRRPPGPIPHSPSALRSSSHLETRPKTAGSSQVKSARSICAAGWSSCRPATRRRARCCRAKDR